MVAAIAATSMMTCASGADLFPLRGGNSWTYRDSTTGQTFTMSVSGTLFYLNDHTYYSLRGYTDQPILVRLDEQQDLVVFDQEAYTERKLISFQPSDTYWWEAPNRTCEQEGQTAERRVLHEGPAGPIPDVLEVRYRTFGCADVGAEVEQFAENIGMVRRVNNTIAGPRTFDLIEANVNKVHVAAQPSGSFSVVVTDVDLKGDITAHLNLRLGAGKTFKLDFPTGQEYDVVVRGEDGRMLWLFSSTALFVQALHSRDIDGSWSIPVKIPRGAFTGSTNYTIEGWLTTTGSNPRFGAVARIAIPQ
jgi:hypothetical protein